MKMQTMYRTGDAVNAIGCRKRLRPDHIPDQLENLFGIRPVHRVKNGKRTNLLWAAADVEKARGLNDLWRNDHAGYLGKTFRKPLFLHERKEPEIDTTLEDHAHGKCRWWNELEPVKSPSLLDPGVMLFIGFVAGFAMCCLVYMAGGAG